MPSIGARVSQATTSNERRTRAHGRRSGAERAPERAREMAVRGESQLEREGGEIGARFQPFHRGAQAHLVEMGVHGVARLRAEDAREMEARAAGDAGEVREREPFAEPGG